MAYPFEVKERAFFLWSQPDGLSFEEIAREIGTSVATIKRWSVKHHWKARRDEIRKKAAAKADRKAADLISKLTAELSQLAEITFDKLVSEVTSPKTFEGGVSSYIGIVKQLRELRKVPADTFDLKIAQIVEIFFRVLGEDRVIGPLIDRRRDKIVAKLENAFAEASG